MIVRLGFKCVAVKDMMRRGFDLSSIGMPLFRCRIFVGNWSQEKTMLTELSSEKEAFGFNSYHLDNVVFKNVGPVNVAVDFDFNCR